MIVDDCNKRKRKRQRKTMMQIEDLLSKNNYKQPNLGEPRTISMKRMKKSHLNEFSHLIIKIFIFLCLMPSLHKQFESSVVFGKKYKGESKTTVIAIDGGSGSSKPHPVPVPWPVVHCHHHHHHLKYVPKPVLVHHWVKKSKYPSEELSATNALASEFKSQPPIAIDEHEIPMIMENNELINSEVGISHQPVETSDGLMLGSNRLASSLADEPRTEGNGSASADWKTNGSSETTNGTSQTSRASSFQRSSEGRFDSSKLHGENNFHFDGPMRKPFGAGPSVDSLIQQVRRANLIEQGHAQRIFNRLAMEQVARLNEIRTGANPMLTKTSSDLLKRPLNMVESKTVELITKLAEQVAQSEAKRRLYKTVNRAASANAAKLSQPVSSPNRNLGRKSGLKNLFGAGALGGPQRDRRLLKKAASSSPAGSLYFRQWHVPFGESLDMQASASSPLIVAAPANMVADKRPPKPSHLSGTLSQDQAAAFYKRQREQMNKYSKYVNRVEIMPGSRPSNGSVRHYRAQSSRVHPQTVESPAREPNPIRFTNASSRHGANIAGRPIWSGSPGFENLGHDQELGAVLYEEKPSSPVASYLEFPVSPELWSIKALESVNKAPLIASTRGQQELQQAQYLDNEALGNLIDSQELSSSDWSNPTLAELNHLLKYSSNFSDPNGVQQKIKPSSESQMEESPSPSTLVSPYSSDFHLTDAINTGTASQFMPSVQKQSAFPFDLGPSASYKSKNQALGFNSILSDPLLESTSADIRQLRQFQGGLAQQALQAGNLTTMMRLSGQLRDLPLVGQVPQFPQLPQIPNIPQPPQIPNIPMPPPGMLLQMAGLALPFAMARATRQNNRNNAPVGQGAAAPGAAVGLSAAGSNNRGRRLFNQALSLTNRIALRRPRRPSSSSSAVGGTKVQPSRSLALMQPVFVRNFFQTVRDMSQPRRPTGSFNVPKIRPKSDSGFIHGHSYRKNSLKIVHNKRVAKARSPEPHYRLQGQTLLAADSDGSIRRFPSMTSPIDTIERELNRHRMNENNLYTWLQIPDEKFLINSSYFEQPYEDSLASGSAQKSTNQMNMTSNGIELSTKEQASILPTVKPIVNEQPLENNNSDDKNTAQPETQVADLERLPRPTNITAEAAAVKLKQTEEFIKTTSNPLEKLDMSVAKAPSFKFTEPSSSTPALSAAKPSTSSDNL